MLPPRWKGKYVEKSILITPGLVDEEERVKGEKKPGKVSIYIEYSTDLGWPVQAAGYRRQHSNTTEVDSGTDEEHMEHFGP
jgi:hypothetical protein